MVRHQLESLLLVLAVGALVAIGAKRVQIPYNVALVVVGLVLVLMAVLPNTPLEPEIILVAFLPVLVFEGALSADAESLRHAQRPILALAIPGVAISLLGTAAIATFALALPVSVALLLGALLSIPDTVSVLLAFRSVRVPHRLAAIMEGESLFNDGTALVLVSLAAVVLSRGTFDPLATTRALAIAMIGGAALGAAFSAVGSTILRQTPDHLTAILVTLVLVFGAALIAERIHASPVIAVVVVGLGVGRTARRHLDPSRVLAMQGFWETSVFLLNVLIFSLVGMQLEARMLLREAPAILLAMLALHVGRAVAVYGTFAVLRAVARERVPMKWQHVMVVGNIKGALSMAAVLALPPDLPYRDRLVTIVFGVTFFTLMTQALPFGKILRLLKVAHGSADDRLDSAKATLIAARRGQAELDGLLAAGLIDRQDHAERRATFQRAVIEAERVLRGPKGEHARDVLVDRTLISVQKAAVLDAARQGLVDAEVAGRQVNQMDRALLALERHEEES